MDNLTPCPSCGQFYDSKEKACPYCQGGIKDKTKFVKGWIVCVKGERAGESEEIKQGENPICIYRNRNADGDKLYLYHDYDEEAKKGTTYLSPGFTRDLIYDSDGNVIKGIVNIEDCGGKITVGKSVFCYVSFDLHTAYYEDD